MPRRYEARQLAAHGRKCCSQCCAKTRAVGRADNADLRIPAGVSSGRGTAAGYSSPGVPGTRSAEFPARSASPWQRSTTAASRTWP